MRHLADKQGAVVRPRPVLTGRHRAPTGAPARTNVRVGGEGTTSASAVDRADGRNWVGSVTRPDGICKRFRHLPCFDGYVGVWREAGFHLQWHDPRTVTISREAI